MRAPTTYTREQMAEVYSHGGPAVQKAILALMMRKGARLAEPGEFTRRAFLNGRIDLAQAESVLDIIESESESELACALAHVQGLLSARINAAKQEVADAPGRGGGGDRLSRRSPRPARCGRPARPHRERPRRNRRGSSHPMTRAGPSGRGSRC